jgi:hypothetical protein
VHQTTHGGETDVPACPPARVGPLVVREPSRRGQDGAEEAAEYARRVASLVLRGRAVTSYSVRWRFSAAGGKREGTDLHAFGRPWTVIEASARRQTLRGEERAHTEGGEGEEAGVGACAWVGVERVGYPVEDAEVDCGGGCTSGPYQI